MSTIGKQLIFTISEAADFLGVSAETLRNWERAGKLTPKRTKGGSRRYRLAELNKANGSRSSRGGTSEGTLQAPVDSPTSPLTAQQDPVTAKQQGSQAEREVLISPLANTLNESSPVRDEQSIPTPSRDIFEPKKYIYSYINNFSNGMNNIFWSPKLTSAGLLSGFALAGLMVLATAALSTANYVKPAETQKALTQGGTVLANFSSRFVIARPEAVAISEVTSNPQDPSNVLGVTDRVAPLIDRFVTFLLSKIQPYFQRALLAILPLTSSNIPLISSTDSESSESAATSDSCTTCDQAVTATLSGLGVFSTLDKIPALTSTYIEDLDGSKLTKVNADHIDGIDSQSWLRSDEADSAHGALTFYGLPGSVDVSGGSIYINPQGTTSNYTLFGVAVSNASKFRVDAEGDAVLAGNLNLVNLYASGTLQVQGTATLYSGSGVPSDSTGANGDYYFRADGTSGNTSIYFRTGGTWISAGGGSLQNAYTVGQSIAVTSGTGALAFDLQSANFDIAVGEGSDTGDFRIWDGSANWLHIDESADTLALGAAAGSGITIGGTGITTAITGNATTTDTSNTVAALTVTNNTATTLGASSSIGISNLTSTSLTTGTLLNLQLTEGTLAGGYYARAWDATAGSAVWSIGEDGAQTTTGLEGSTMFTLTAGDAIISDGSLAVTDDDNATSFSLTNNTATTVGVGVNTDGVADISSTSLTTGNLLNLETTTTLTTGKMLNLSSTSAVLTTGNLISMDWSPGSVPSTAPTGDLFKLNIGANATNFAGNFFNLLDNSSSIFSVSKTAVTSSLPLNLTAPGDVAIAYDLVFTNPVASFIKSAASLNLVAGETFGSQNLNLQTYNFGSVVIDGVVTTSAAAATKYAQYINTGDTTAVADTIYGSYITNALTGNAAKIGYGLYGTVTSSSTTADTLYGVDLATDVTGIMTTGTRNIYGLRSQPSAGAESTGGTTNVYGGYFKTSGDVASGGTINSYGAYIANGTYDTDGTNTAYGLYIEAMSGADTNTSLYNAGTTTLVGATTITGTEASTSFTLTAGDAAISDGSLSVTDDDNATSFTTINNTATTIGASAVSGVNVLSSTSLTTGNLLSLELAEGTLAGGYYARAWDTTAGAAVWSIGEDGAQTIAGTAEGTSALTLTAGDLVLTDGDLTVSGGETSLTSNSNTVATLGVTNNTLTTLGAGLNTTGMVDYSSTSLTTGNLMNLETTTTLTSGKMLNISSTSTALTTGNLISLDWTPGSVPSTAPTGDLFKLNIGANATNFAGNFFNLLDNGSSIFSVSKTAVTSSLPTAFNAPGDTGMAYDLVFTNPTASYIKSLAPLALVAGDTFASSDLTLQTYNFGSVVVDGVVTTSASAATKYAQYINTGDTTAVADTIYGTYINNALTGNAAKIGYGLYGTVTSSSTTADTLYGADLATDVTGIMTTGTRNIFGLRSQPSAGAESSGGTTNVYGGYFKASGDVAASGTINNYGLYVANGTYDTDGTSISNGIYVEDITGADTNYGIQVADFDAGYPFYYNSNSGIFSVDYNADLAARYINITGNVTAALGFSAEGGAFYTPAYGTAMAFNNGLFTVQKNNSPSVTAELFSTRTAAQTLTITGGFTDQRFNQYLRPTITAASALTVTNSATLYVENAPAVAASAVITNPYALWIDAGTSRFDGAVAYGAQQTFVDADTTPDVSGGTNWITNTSGVTITDFDAGSGTLQPGHIIYVESAGAIVYDVTSSGLEGGAGDITTAAGDLTSWIYDGSQWKLINWVETADTQSGGADLAELYSSDDSLEAGDVVSIPSSSYRSPLNSSSTHVVKSSTPYDRRAMGIVSTKPGITLSDNTETGNTYPIALSGRVPVKVSSTSQAIEAGDFVTSSAEAGKAQKATRSGQMLGRALEAWSPTSGKSTVLVFVGTSYAHPNFELALSESGEVSDDSIASSNSPLDSSNSEAITSLEERIADLDQKIGNLSTIQDLSFLTDRIKTLEAFVLGEATPSAEASSSADPLDSSNLPLTSSNELALTGDLTVLGKTILSSTTVTGDFSVAHLQIKESDTLGTTLNSLGTLTLQSSLGGGVTIDQLGNMIVSGTLTVEQGITLDTKGDRPTCDKNSRGKVWLTQGEDGVEDKLEVCVKDSKDKYVWKETFLY